MDELRTERLTLRRVPQDAAKAILDGRDPDGIELADGYPSEFSLEVMEMVASGHSASGPDAFGPYFIHRRDDDAVIGEIGSGEVADGVTQAGYSLVEDAWNKGYATEALGAVIDRALADPRVDALAAETFAHMTASRRVMEKAGMELVSETAAEHEGEQVTLVRYEIRAEPSP